VFFCSLLLWLLAIRRIKRRFIQNQNEQNHSSFQQLDSQLENKIRLLELYFGNDSRTRNHITQLKQELLKLTTRKKQLVLFEILIYIISLLTLIVIGYFTQI